MSKTLILEVPDALYERVRKAAMQTHSTPAEWVQTNLEPLLPPENEAIPWHRFAPEFLEAAREMAARKQQSLDEFLAVWWAQNGPQPTRVVTAAEAEIFRQQHSGAIQSGNPHSADNDSIDADLAREYGSSHENAA